MPIVEYNVSLQFTGQQGTSAEHEVKVKKTAYLAIPDSLDPATQQGIIKLMGYELPYMQYKGANPIIEDIKIHDESQQSFDAWGDGIAEKNVHDLTYTYNWLVDRIEVEKLRTKAARRIYLEQSMDRTLEKVRQIHDNPPKGPTLSIPELGPIPEIDELLQSLEQEHKATEQDLHKIEQEYKELLEVRKELMELTMRREQLLQKCNDLLQQLGMPGFDPVKYQEEHKQEQQQYPYMRRRDIERGERDR